jgi:universal stress protein E
VENHHGTGRHPARWLLAYTDWELLRLCPIPVLLVKNRRLYHRPRVLAAVDPAHAHAKPSNLDRQILRAGAQLVHALHGELHALHALLPPMPVVRAANCHGPWMASTSNEVTATWSRAVPPT